MTASTRYPVWIGTASWRLMSRRGTSLGTASLITAPGVVAETVLCDHHHRKSRVARECGERMAAVRNASLASTAVAWERYEAPIDVEADFDAHTRARR